MEPCFTNADSQIEAETSSIEIYKLWYNGSGDPEQIKAEWYNKINFRFPFDGGYETGAEENTILKWS